MGVSPGETEKRLKEPSPIPRGGKRTMKFRCNGADLSEGLKRVSGALPARAVKPVLDGVLVEAGGSAVRLTCTDERMTIVTSVRAEVEEDGCGVAPGRIFGEVVRGLTGADVAVSMNERFAFTLKGSGSRTNLSGQDADLFPALPEVAAERVIRMPRGMLKRMIERTAFCVASEDVREVLTGALLAFRNGTATMVGLDGFRMAVCEARTSDVVEDCRVVIPWKALSDIGKMVADDPEAFVALSIGGGKLRADVDGTSVYATLISGEYVDWKGILPKNAATRLTVAVRPLRDAVERAALIARQGNNNLLVLKVAGGEMAVEAHSQVGDSFEKLEVVQEGADLNIAFNVKYVSEALRNVDGDEISMHMNGPIAPCLIRVAGGDTTYLVLPVRTGATK